MEKAISENDDWHEFMDLCHRSKDIWGNSFTYTLINSDDLV